MVHVSAATVWELTIKAMLGKLSVPDKLASRLAEQGLSLLSITAEYAETLREFPELTANGPVMVVVTRTSPPAMPAQQTTVEGLQRCGIPASHAPVKPPTPSQ
jgi:PIN domain nuclease of toxin-antitoxin system